MKTKCESCNEEHNMMEIAGMRKPTTYLLCPNCGQLNDITNAITDFLETMKRIPHPPTNYGQLEQQAQNFYFNSEKARNHYLDHIEFGIAVLKSQGTTRFEELEK